MKYLDLLTNGNDLNKMQKLAILVEYANEFKEDLCTPVSENFVELAQDEFSYWVKTRKMSVENMEGLIKDYKFGSKYYIVKLVLDMGNISNELEDCLADVIEEIMDRVRIEMFPL